MPLRQDRFLLPPGPPQTLKSHPPTWRPQAELSRAVPLLQARLLSAVKAEQEAEAEALAALYARTSVSKLQREGLVLAGLVSLRARGLAFGVSWTAMGPYELQRETWGGWGTKAHQQVRLASHLHILYSLVFFPHRQPSPSLTSSGPWSGALSFPAPPIAAATTATARAQPTGASQLAAAKHQSMGTGHTAAAVEVAGQAAATSSSSCPTIASGRGTRCSSLTLEGGPAGGQAVEGALVAERARVHGTWKELCWRSGNLT